MEKIKQVLTKKFKSNRIVFWYDDKQDMRDKYERVSLPGVEKIEIDNNEFGIKYRILRKQPDQKFLVYHEGPAPPYVENWLLDVFLAHDVFSADQESLWISELGLGPEFRDLAVDHRAFFEAKPRRQALKQMLQADDAPPQIKQKMLAISAGLSNSAQFNAIVERLLTEEAEQERDQAGFHMRLIQRSHLDDFLWRQFETHFDYYSEKRSIADFAIKLFESCYHLGLHEEAKLSSYSLQFMNRWKDSRSHYQAFETLSEEYATPLGIEQDLQHRDIGQLAELDYFALIDKKILFKLSKQVIAQTKTAHECQEYIRKRRRTHWYADFEHIYQAIWYGAQFLSDLRKTKLTMNSLEEGINNYVERWHKLDKAYRKFIYHVQASKQITLLETLLDKVQNTYANQFLIKLNDNWQLVINSAPKWSLSGVVNQQDFFDHFVRQKYLKKNHKVVVVISDAMRFEVGSELSERIGGEDGFQVELYPTLGVLPSETCLGMASLLPHKTMTLEKTGSVRVDGKRTQSTQNRAKILAEAVPEGGTALLASDLLNMVTQERRALFRDHAVIYIYHDQIDDVGHNLITESQAFEAAETALDELINIIKKMISANASNLLITSDHGFLYQHNELDKSDYAKMTVDKSQVSKQTRRWVLSEVDELGASFKKFRSDALGYQIESNLFVVKSINRLPKQGATSRFVHGGASLQEIVLPVLWVNKNWDREDVKAVDVDILRSTSSIISTGQFIVSFYQVQPVSTERKARKLRARLYAQDNELISDTHEIVFDQKTDEVRKREVKITFFLSKKAENYNLQEVILKLEEQHPRTTKYIEYKSARYKLQRSFTTDFDL